MLKKRIIACLDVAQGRVVKGVRFQQHEDVGDILELSKRYSEQGIDELVFYAPFLKITLRLFCIKAFFRSENLYIHGCFRLSVLLFFLQFILA